VDEKDLRAFLLAEKTALLLACLRNYRRFGQRVDLQGAMDLEPEVSRLVDDVRDALPRPE
jgi:hypothetical protein